MYAHKIILSEYSRVLQSESVSSLRKRTRVNSRAKSFKEMYPGGGAHRRMSSPGRVYQAKFERSRQ